LKANLKAHLALAAVNLIYGCNYLVVKEITPEWLPPMALVVMRAVGAFVLFASLYFLWVKEPIDRKDWPRLIACAMFGVAINMSLFIKGLSLTSPINASLIMITAPILVLIFSAFILKEKLTTLKIGGIILGALGAFYLIWQTADSVKSANWLGDLMIFINAASYALYLVLVKPLMKKYQPITVMVVVFGFGMFGISLVGAIDLGQSNLAAIPLNIWLAIAYVIVMVTFFTYLLNIYALTKLNPSVVGSYIYTQPIIASSLAVLMGKYPLSPAHLVAAILIFTGVYLVGKTNKKSTIQETR